MTPTLLALIRPRIRSAAAAPAAPAARRGLLALAASALLGLATLAPPAQAQIGSTAPVRIGVIGPFTGASADFGVPMLNGIRMAVEEINAVGGYLGSMSFRVESNTVTGASPARTGWPAGA